MNAQIAVSTQAAAVAQAELTAANRVATASMVGLRGAGAGLLAMLGGPWGIAIAAAAAGGYLLYRALGEAERKNDDLRESLGGAKTALDEYEQASLDAATATGDAAVKAREHAAALRKEAEDAVYAARALREKALAEAETADAAALRSRDEAPTRIGIAGFAAVGGDPIGLALAGTAPTVLADQRATNARSKAAAAADAATAAEERYKKILDGASASAGANATATDKATKAKRGAKDETDDYIKRLRDEVQEIGLTEKGQRRLEIARAVAAAPTAAQKVVIQQLSDEREAALTTAAAWERLADLKSKNDERTMSPAQRVRAANAAALNDADAGDGLVSVAEESLRLAGEVEERWTEALSAIRGEFKTTADAMSDLPKFEVLNLERDLDALQVLESQAVAAAQNIGEAFGKTGDIIGAGLVAVSNYRSTEAALGVQIAKGEKTQAQASAELRNVRVRGYGDMARAAKGYFDEGSTGYRVLQTAEIAFRTVETLNTIQAMTLDSAHTASSVVNSGARASADGVAAYAKTLASLPFPFNLAAGATVLASLAAVGVAIAGGGGGGGSVPGASDYQDRQAAQGAGSVLGDVSAKSESLSRALDIVASNTNRELEYSNSMLRSLRSIDSNIGSLTSALARQLRVDAILNGSSFQASSNFNRSGVGDFLSTAPILGGFLGSLFGTKTTTTLQDVGLQFGGQTIADILAGGLEGQTYQQVLTTRKKKLFGITTGTKSSVSTDYGDLDAGLEDDFTRVIASLRDGVLSAAGVIGVEGAQATLDAFTLNLGTISLKDLKGDELENALSAIFGKAADQMADAVLPGIDAFQRAGEGAFETLTRLARDYQVIDVTLTAIGKTFDLVGLESLEARERLIDLAGGLDEFQEGASFFAENFLSEAERLAPVQRAVIEELKRLGLAAVDTRDEFKAAVLGLDVTTEAGAELYAALMSLAPAFDAVTDAAEETAARRKEFFDDNFLTDAERIAPTQRQVAAELERLGLASIKTRDDFKAAVLGIDTTTDAGVKLRDALLDLAPAFIDVVNYTDNVKAAAEKLADDAVSLAKDNASKAKSELQAEYQRQSAALEQQIDAFSAISRGLREYGDRLTIQTGRTPRAQRDAAEAQFLAAAAAVRANPQDRDAYAKLQSAGDAFIQASKAGAANALALDADQQAVRREIEAAAGIAGRQADTAEAQLSALNDLVAGQLEQTKDQKTMVQLLAAVATTNAALVSALATRGALEPAPANDDFDADRYLAGNKDIGRYAAANGLDPRAFAREHYLGTGQYEIAAGLRKYAAGTDGAWGGATQVNETGGEVINLPQGAQVYPNEALHQMFGGPIEQMAAAIRSMQAEMERLRADNNRGHAETAKQTKKGSDVLERAQLVGGGNNLGVKVA